MKKVFFILGKNTRDDFFLRSLLNIITKNFELKVVNYDNASKLIDFEESRNDIFIINNYPELEQGDVEKMLYFRNTVVILNDEIFLNEESIDNLKFLHTVNSMCKKIIFKSKHTYDLYKKYLKISQNNISVKNYTLPPLIDFDLALKCLSFESKINSTKFAILENCTDYKLYESVKYAKENNLEFEIIKNPKNEEEVFEVIKNYKGLIHLPLKEESCEDLFFYLKFSKLEIITNSNLKTIKDLYNSDEKSKIIEEFNLNSQYIRETFNA